MRRPTLASRFIVLASLLALVGSLVVSAPAVLAVRPIRGQVTRLSHQPGPASSGHRPFRVVDVSRLPQGAGKPSASRPLVGPTRSAAPRPPSIAIVAPVEATPPSATPAASEPTAFAGSTSSSVEPPDSGVAAGPDHVVQVSATGVRITDRIGGHVQNFSLNDFFGTTPLPPPYNLAEAFNPRIIFDTLHNRWVAIETSFNCVPDVAHNILVGHGYIDVAYSFSADPTGSWGVLALEYGDKVPDDPAIGTSTDKIVVSTNVLTLAAGGGANGCHAAGMVGTEMDGFAWSDMLGNGDVWVNFWPSDFSTFPSLPNNVSSWRPAHMAPATTELVHVIGRQTDDHMVYLSITGNPAAGGSAFLSAITDLTTAGVVGAFATPPAPQQPGSPATITNAVDGRPTDAVWQNNRMVIQSTYGCDPAGGIAEIRDCVRITELNTTAATPTLNQDFLVAEEGADLFNGGAALALNGDLHAVWARSSAVGTGPFPSSQTALQLRTDAPNTIGARTTIAAGTATYAGTGWGDYTGVAQDPQVPNAVWQAGEYSVGSLWGTHVSMLQTGGSSYTPITPLRVLDDRPLAGIGLTGAFNANQPRSWQVTGVGSIPADAIAVTGNVTVTNQTAGGYLSVTNNPTATPPSSTLNFPLGDTRANNVTVPLSETGMLSATYKAPNGRITNLIFDVTGYFTAGNTHGTYTPLPPVRVLDSRAAAHIGLTGRFLPNVPRTLTIGGGAIGGVPADAVAITGNLTVVGQSRAGYLAVTPDPDPNPTTSTLNFPLGDTRANGISVPLNGSGELSIVYKASGGSTDVILDVTGYYRNNPGGLLFYPLSPGRMMDSRPGVVLSGLTGPFNASSPRVLTTADHWGVPAGAAAITANLTVVGQTAAGYVAITVTPTATPTTSSINFPLGDVRANGVTVPTNAGTDLALVYKARSGKTHLILDVTGYFK